MAAAKTKPTPVTARDFIASVPDEGRRADALALLRIFQRATGEKPVMWGPSIVGFGSYHYRYESGREGDMCLAGFSPRSTALVLYGVTGGQQAEAMLARLGTWKRGKGCLYVKRLSDVDPKVLEELVRVGAEQTRKTSQRDAGVDGRTAAKKSKERRAVDR